MRSDVFENNIEFDGKISLNNLIMSQLLTVMLRDAIFLNLNTTNKPKHYVIVHYQSSNNSNTWSL